LKIHKTNIFGKITTILLSYRIGRLIKYFAMFYVLLLCLPIKLRIIKLKSVFLINSMFFSSLKSFYEGVRRICIRNKIVFFCFGRNSITFAYKSTKPIG
jgi:hypothetical protein